MPFVSQDTHILAPWTGDFHPDHEACGRAACEVARRSGAALTFYFFWTLAPWEGQIACSIMVFPLKSVSLSVEDQLAKAEAMSRVSTARSSIASGQPILPEELLLASPTIL